MEALEAGIPWTFESFPEYLDAVEGAGEPVAAPEHIRQASAEIEALTAGASPSALYITLRTRALALEGHTRAKLGEGRAGVELTRRALELALEWGIDVAAAEASPRGWTALPHVYDVHAARPIELVLHDRVTRETGYDPGQRLPFLEQQLQYQSRADRRIPAEVQVLHDHATVALAADR